MLSFNALLEYECELLYLRQNNSDEKENTGDKEIYNDRRVKLTPALVKVGSSEIHNLEGRFRKTRSIHKRSFPEYDSSLFYRISL